LNLAGNARKKNMTSVPTTLPEQSLFTRLRFLNERAIFAFGLGAFLLVLLISIAARLYLEALFGGLGGTQAVGASKERLLVKGDILVPVTLSVKLVDGRAILRGTLPTEDAHQTVVARAQTLYGVQNVEDNLGVQPDIVVTPWFDSVLKWFPPRVGDLRNGEISVSGMNVFLFGDVPNIDARSAAQLVFAKLIGPEGHFSNGLQVKYAADNADTPRANTASAPSKESGTTRTTNFKVQF
jgi:BON domain